MPCAPKCMKRILETIHGNEVDQALLDVDTRKLAYRYLIENGIEEEHIVAFSRPRNIIAYELEEPSLSWKSENGEETIATAVQNENAKYVIAQNEEKAYQPISCSTMMSKGLCPYRTPSQTAVPPDEWKRAFVFGKKRCHDNLAEIHEARKASGRSIGVAVKSAWTMSPWCYTQTAFKGEGANADLQAKREKEREAKQSQKRKATDTVKEQKKAEKQAKKQKCDEEKAERKKEREAKREAKVAKVNEESARIQEDLFDEVDDTFLEEFSRDRDEEEVEMEFAPLRTQ